MEDVSDGQIALMMVAMLIKALDFERTARGIDGFSIGETIRDGLAGSIQDGQEQREQGIRKLHGIEIENSKIANATLAYLQCHWPADPQSPQ